MRKNEKIAVGKIQILDIDLPQISKRNARAHPERNISDIKASLSRYGQQTPIVLNSKGVVLKGTGTLLAARQLGWKHIAVVYSALKDYEAEAYSIADNQTGLTSEWDYQLFGERLKVLINSKGIPAADLGFLPHEIEPLLKANWTPPDLEALPGSSGTSNTIESDDLVMELSGDDRLTVLAAIERARVICKDPELEQGSALALICQFYLEKKKGKSNDKM